MNTKNETLLPVPHEYVGVEKPLTPLVGFRKIKAITEEQIKLLWAILKAKNVEFLKYDHYADKVNEAYNMMQFALLQNRIYAHNNTLVNREAFQRLNEPEQTDSEILSNYVIKNYRVQLIAQSIAQEYLDVVCRYVPNSCKAGTKTGYSYRHNLSGKTDVCIAVLEGKELTFINMTYEETQYKVFLANLKSVLSVLGYLARITLLYWGLCFYQALYSFSLLLWTTILCTVWVGLCIVVWVEKCYTEYESKYMHNKDRPTLHSVSAQQIEYQNQALKVGQTIDALNKARGQK